MKDDIRIRRTNVLPRFASREAADRARYPYKLVVPGSDAVLHYRRTRQQADLDYGDGLLRRHLFAWLVLKDKRIGAFEINEIDPNGCADNDDFMLAMDANEKFEADMSCVLCAHWKDIIGDVTHAGPILDFRFAWIAPEHSGGRVFANASHALIERFCPRYSLLVIKGFPLEYEAHEPDSNTSTSKAIDRRQKAMVRYYQRIFGVRPFPGPDGKEGWLFRHVELF
jgi:hypothetical protein